MRIQTIYDYYNFCRDITIEMNDKNSVNFHPTDNMQIELQIDESVFGKKCKYNRGKPHNNYWIFGISDSKNHKCLLKIVENRSEETLMGIIEHFVPKQSSIKIISDGLASYSKLRERGYNHAVVIHKEEFVNED